MKEAFVCIWISLRSLVALIVSTVLHLWIMVQLFVYIRKWETLDVHSKLHLVWQVQDLIDSTEQTIENNFVTNGTCSKLSIRILKAQIRDYNSCLLVMKL